MSENAQSKPVKTTHRMRGFVLVVALLIVAFLGGFIWMGLKFRACSSSLAKAQSQLSLAKMQNSLGSAAIDARRGDYETARVAASDFFTALRAETDKGVDSALSQAQIDGAQPLFAQRDQIITLLSRGDVASADTLSDLYIAYSKLVNP
jgi:uncharacterized membrane protein